MLRKTLWTALLVASTATYAGAALWSPPLAASWHERLNCRVMNVSPIVHHVTIQIPDSNGSVLVNQVLDLAPGHSFSATTPPGDVWGYCWVGGIAKSDARVTFSSLDDQDLSTITAVQVR
jgi:hypothetical protein